MAAQAINIQQEKLDLIQTIASLEDMEVVKKIKRSIARLVAPKPDPLYSPENIAAIEQAYEEYKQGKSTRMTMEELDELINKALEA